MGRPPAPSRTTQRARQGRLQLPIDSLPWGLHNKMESLCYPIAAIPQADRVGKFDDFGVIKMRPQPGEAVVVT